jgi:hypothetical protein
MKFSVTNLVLEENRIIFDIALKAILTGKIQDVVIQKNKLKKHLKAFS